VSYTRQNAQAPRRSASDTTICHRSRHRLDYEHRRIRGVGQRSQTATTGTSLRYLYGDEYKGGELKQGNGRTPTADAGSENRDATPLHSARPAHAPARVLQSETTQRREPAMESCNRPEGMRIPLVPLLMALFGMVVHSCSVWVRMLLAIASRR